jgi:superfamily II DNA or RNA helicase
MHLRFYASDDLPVILDACTRGRSTGVHYGVGAGKTLFSLTAASFLLRHSGVLDKAIFLAPSTSIVGQFVRASDGGKVIQTTNEDLSVELYAGSRAKGHAAFTRLLHDDHVKGIVSTHQLLARGVGDAPDVYTDCLLQLLQLPERVRKRTLIVFDEAHRIPYLAPDDPDRSHKLAIAERALRQHGFLIMKLTGTPKRNEKKKRPIFGPDDVVVTRPLTALMEYELAPRLITCETISIRGKSAQNEDAVYVPLELDDVAKAVNERWTQLGRPPALLRALPGEASHNQAVFAAIERCVGTENIINAYGDDNLERFEAQIKLEEDGIENRTLRYESCQNLIVGITRIVEGINSPPRVLAFFLGVPRAEGVFIQFFGRTMRLKFDENKRPLIIGMPEEWLDRVHLVFLVAHKAESKDIHVHVLYQSLVIIDCHNYSGMLSKALRRFSGQVRKPDNREPTNKTRQATEADLRDAANNAEAHELKRWAEANIRSYEVTCFERAAYNHLRVSEKLSCIEAWLTAYEQNAARTHQGVQNPLEALAVAEERVKSLPLEAIRDLLTLEVAAAAHDQEQEAKAPRQRVYAPQGDPAFELLLDNFAMDISNPYGALLDSVVIRHYKNKAENIDRKKATPLDSLDELWRRIELFLQTHGRYPLPSDTDPLDPTTTFRDYERQLDTGDYDGFTGELGEFVVARLKLNWYREAKKLSEHIEGIHTQHDPTKALKAFRKAGATWEARIAASYPDNPIAVYFPKVVRLITSGCSATYLRSLSIIDARDLTRLSKAQLRQMATASP